MIFIIFHSDDFSFKQAERQGSARVLCFRRGLNRPACMVLLVILKDSRDS